MATALFGISGPSEADLLRVARAVFHETFLNLTDDETIRSTGIAAGQELKAWIAAEREARLDQRRVRAPTCSGGLLEKERAGLLNDAEVAHVLAGLLVGSIDTTATVGVEHRRRDPVGLGGSRKTSAATSTTGAGSMAGAGRR